MERKLKARRRDELGKGAAHRIRAAGAVPGVVYGHGNEPLHISVDARELFHTLHTDAGVNVLVDLRVDGDHFLAMPREIQRDLMKGRLLHVDFLRIARDEKIAVDVPVQLVGESRGVKEGGVLEHHLWALHLEAFPQDVPPAIEADVSRLTIGDSLKVGDLTFDGKLTILTPPEEVIVSVVSPQILRAEEEVTPEMAEAAEQAEGGLARAGEVVDEASSP